MTNTPIQTYRRYMAKIRALSARFAILLLPLWGAGPALGEAQGLFSAAISVDGSIITAHDIEQRKRLLTALQRGQGNLERAARNSLITDRLRLNEFRAFGRSLSEDRVTEEMSAIAQQTGFELEQFLEELSLRGVDERALRDFARADLAWNLLVRDQFRSKVQISEEEVARALAQSGQATSLRVLLSEMFLPAPPGDPARVRKSRALAEEISQLTSEEEFSARARELSIAPSRRNGGKLNWMNVSELSPRLRGVVLGLTPGQVSRPLPLNDRIGLLQLRAIQEIPRPAPDTSMIEYAILTLPTDNPEPSVDFTELSRNLDTCEDLYGAALSLPDSNLERRIEASAQISTKIAVPLQNLDVNEVAFLEDDATNEASLLMLCNRIPSLGGGDEREIVRLQLQRQRLQNFAISYLAELRAAANIRFY